MRKHRHKSLAILIILYLITITIIHVLADDAAVMAKLAKSLFPTPFGWFGNNPCRWSGVECDKSGHVTSITLSFKSLSGELPEELNQLSSLASLNLQGNKFSGTLPSLSNLASLQEVYFDGNNFTSFQSGFLSGLTNLQTFSISQNSNLLPWTIPESLKDSTTLVTFQASKANIMGTIPDIFGSFPNLQSLRLSYNNITGSLPPSFGKSGIQHLWLNNQLTGLSGGLDVLGTMSQLTQAWVHVNKFTGPIPDLSSCVNLFDLQLRDNQLTGVIPASLTSLPKLVNVSLQNNIFQGPVPVFPNSVRVSLGNTNSFCKPSPGPCDPQVNILLDTAGALGYPVEIAESWQGNDPCENWRYISCGSGSVIVINFAKQNFVGTISPAIANLTSLKTLMLSDNKLTGVIPASLTSLKYLQLLDVTNNNLSGKVPEFGPGVVVKTSGNPFIGVDLSSDSSSGSVSNGRKSNVLQWLFPVIAVVIVIIAAILGFVVYRRYMKRRREDYKSVKVGVKSKKSDDALANSNGITYSGDFHMTVGVSVSIPIEVLVEATDNFNQENKIGEGGFGVVYKGKLHDGTQIAVKRMESSLINKAGLNEFRAEIEVLSKVRHRNLVALHGFCVHGNDRLLVYEYMPQGSLEHHLFKWRQTGNSQPISWKQRISIALDVARGVEYLHSLTQQSFIHRDLKPSNILLGDDMKAKVSDFGLVKSAPDGKYSLETRLAGTFGYLAPEYAATGRVTTKVDVYAYGVILMELMTGQKALDDTLPEERSHLVSWFRNVIINTNNLVSCLDPSIETDEETLKSIYKVAELAGHCTAREPSQRPDMTHVVNVLSPLVVRWTPRCNNEEDENIAIDLHMTLPQALEKWKASEGKSTSSYLYTSDDMSGTFTTKRASETTSSFSSPDGQ